MRALLASALTLPIRFWLVEESGQRIDRAVSDALPVAQMDLNLYGKAQSLRLRSAIAVARFLKVPHLRTVWREMQQADNTWSRPRPILARICGSSRSIPF